MTAEIGQCASCTKEIEEGEIYTELPQKRNGEEIGTLVVHNACFLESLCGKDVPEAIHSRG